MSAVIKGTAYLNRRRNILCASFETKERCYIAWNKSEIKYWLPSVDIKTKSDALARLGLTQETSVLPLCTIHHPHTEKTDIKPMFFNTLQKHKAVCLLTHSKQQLKSSFNTIDKSELLSLEDSAQLQACLYSVSVLLCWHCKVSNIKC